MKSSRSWEHESGRSGCSMGVAWRSMRHVSGLQWFSASILVLASLCLTACSGEDGPTSEVTGAVRDELLPIASATQMEVGNIAIADFGAGAAGARTTSWSAELVAKERIAAVVDNVEGTFVVRTLLDEGGTVPVYGTATAEQLGDKWITDVEISEKGGLLTLMKQADGRRFAPVSLLTPHVNDGSDEAALLQQGVEERIALRVQREQAERVAEAQAASKARLEEERVRQEEKRELAEIQADAERQRREIEAEARHAELLAWLDVFRSDQGSMSLGNGLKTIERGRLYTEATVDESTMTVRGAGLDLSTMPFQPFTFEGRLSLDGRGNTTLTITESRSSSPTVRNQRLPDGTLVHGRNGELRTFPLSANERARLDAMIAAAERAASAAEPQIGLRTVGGQETASELQDLQASPLVADWIYGEGQSFQTANPFIHDGSFKKYQRISGPAEYRIRFREPDALSGMGFHIHDPGDFASVSLVVNGIHRYDLTAPPSRGGLVLVRFPDETEVVELGIEIFGAMEVYEVFRFDQD